MLVLEDLNEFYGQLRSRQHGLFSLKVNPQHSSLIPRLRPYQCETIRWMLWRERAVKPAISSCSVNESFYRPLIDLNGNVIFYNEVGGVLTEKKPEECGWTKGGILAEEMGLGKTIETLAVILLNPRPAAVANSIIPENDVVDASDSDYSEVIKDGAENIAASVACLIEDVIYEADQELKFEELLLSPGKRKRKNRTDLSVSRRSASQTNLDAAPSILSPKRCRKSEGAAAPRLECNCGATFFDIDDQEMLQCAKCWAFQHRSCMSYKDHYTGDYLCPCCRFNADPIPSRATLIISPASICYQWYEEIQKHVRSENLQVLIYEGILAKGYIQPISTW
jgi:E3 ubiquitin-protein ligase SHPRH